MWGLTLGGTPSGVSDPAAALAPPFVFVLFAGAVAMEDVADAKVDADRDPPEVDRATNPSGSFVN
jgi:hypothetical protein